MPAVSCPAVSAIHRLDLAAVPNRDPVKIPVDAKTCCVDHDVHDDYSHDDHHDHAHANYVMLKYVVFDLSAETIHRYYQVFLIEVFSEKLSCFSPGYWNGVYFHDDLSVNVVTRETEKRLYVLHDREARTVCPLEIL